MVSLPGRYTEAKHSTLQKRENAEEKYFASSFYLRARLSQSTWTSENGNPFYQQGAEWIFNIVWSRK